MSDGYLDYPRRRPGPDHDRYDASPLPARRPRVHWPGGAPVAVWVVVSIDSFRPDAPRSPFAARGAPTRDWFDYREWTLRDYGLRVGLFRILEALEASGLPATAAISADACGRAPAAVEAVLTHGCEALGYGLSSSLPLHDAMPEAEERMIIADSLGILRGATGQPVRGWLGPSMSESSRTLDLLVEHGIDYVCDWVNDELPYPMRTTGGVLHALPYSWEINDLTITQELHQPAHELERAIADQFAYLAEEARRDGGRAMCIALHAWVAGQPHRIGALRRALERIVSSGDAWFATGSQLLAAFLASQEQSPPGP
jgi:peptidoglycan/xylan/chitin deacetylase (PgdA/CDA1 family)